MMLPRAKILGKEIKENLVLPRVYENGWFFKKEKGQERTFDVKEQSQIPYAMDLIMQSYK